MQCDEITREKVYNIIIIIIIHVLRICFSADDEIIRMNQLCSFVLLDKLIFFSFVFKKKKLAICL